REQVNEGGMDSERRAAGTEASSRSVFLNRLGSLHPCIRCDDWRSPLVHRLIAKRDYEDGRRAVTAVYIWNNSEEAPIDIEWNSLSDDFRKCLNTYQAPVL